MYFKKRPLGRLLQAPLNTDNYRAFWNMIRVSPNFIDTFRRYVFAQGTYPYKIRLRTPIGEITPTLYSHEDMLTANEVFCREDYRSDSKVQVVVDIGANIGLSVLYFLTRNPTVKCYVYEPVSENLQRLSANLQGFADRVEIVPAALGDREELRSFGAEPSGRYGGFQDFKFSDFQGDVITVPCRCVDKELDRILSKEERINLIKIDVEGAEFEVLSAIRPDQLARIDTIIWETINEPGVTRLKPGKTDVTHTFEKIKAQQTKFLNKLHSSRL